MTLRPQEELAIQYLRIAEEQRDHHTARHKDAIERRRLLAAQVEYAGPQTPDWLSNFRDAGLDSDTAAIEYHAAQAGSWQATARYLRSLSVNIRTEK